MEFWRTYLPKTFFQEDPFIIKILASSNAVFAASGMTNKLKHLFRAVVADPLLTLTLILQSALFQALCYFLAFIFLSGIFQTSGP